MKFLQYFIANLIIFSSNLSAGESADSSIFEGRYHGQGRGCGGTLTIAPNNISLHTQPINCELRSTEVLEEEHVGYHHRVLYQFKKKNKNCKLHAIELEHSESFPSYMLGWQITGFLTKKQYEDRSNPASASYVCGLIKDYNPHNNPAPTGLSTSK